MKERDVERLLADQPTPPPPEGLAERIKNEIPDDLELSPEILRTSRVMPMRRRRRWYMAAAAAMTITLAGAVTWQMRETRLSTAVFEIADETLVGDTVATNQPAPVSSVDEIAGRDQAGSLAEGLETVGALEGRAGERSREEAPARQELKVTGSASSTDPEAPQDKERLVRAGGKGDTRETMSEAEEDSVQGYKNKATQPMPAEAGKSSADSDDEVFFEVRDAPRSPDSEAPMDTRANNEQPVQRQAEPNTRMQTTSPETSGEIAESEELLSRIDEYRPRKKEAVIAVAKPVTAPHPELPAGSAPSTGGTTEPNDQPYGDVFYREYGVNPFIDTEDDNLSTFGLEVDTGSYTVARRYLRDGHLPPREAVRVEEFLNSFDYGDRPPRRDDFALSAEGAPSPFAEGERYYLLRFAVAAREVAAMNRPAAVLTFVVDTSGSMNRENRLGLVKKALYELLDHLRADDSVGLVVYGSRGDVLLEPTTDHEAIRSAIGRLQGAGSTNAEEGLLLAYELAHEYLERGGINRIILCSDGVANVGRTGPESILERIESFADAGIELTTVGFGMGNYNDVLMEQLADAGDGRYAYVDALPEARRIFVEELTGTLMTVGSEAKAQVEFNSEVVSRYRLLGYENRDIADDRFRDPTVDAGEIGAGHTVTALYEIKLHKGRASNGSILATLRLRYRPIGSDNPVEMEESIRVRQLERSWSAASPSLKLATLVAEFAEILKSSYWAKDGDLQDLLRRTQQLSPDFAGDTRVADLASLIAAAFEIEGSSRQ